MLPIMEHYEFGNLTLVQDQTVSINCNWKAVLDNFSELYHVHYLHPQHQREVAKLVVLHDRQHIF